MTSTIEAGDQVTAARGMRDLVAAEAAGHQAGSHP